MSNMKLIKFKLNGAGVQELLQGEAMQNVLREAAEQKAAAAGEGYEASVMIGQKRAYANITAATDEAKADNLENNTLEKVIRS